MNKSLKSIRRPGFKLYFLALRYKGSYLTSISFIHCCVISHPTVNALKQQGIISHEPMDWARSSSALRLGSFTWKHWVEGLPGASLFSFTWHPFPHISSHMASPVGLLSAGSPDSLSELEDRVPCARAYQASAVSLSLLISLWPKKGTQPSPEPAWEGMSQGRESQEAGSLWLQHPWASTS